MRGKLHVSFRHEEGVDAGGLSREFFSILAKEMFNPNYALFTSTEDGCTFQPNMHSSINPDHLSYFRFVGRIVGKAILDGYLLDAHFTRSLYKHMLGLKVRYISYFVINSNVPCMTHVFHVVSQPTYHDMEAIDPDYYKNLQTILDYNLEDIDLDLTFSTETHSFGRSQTIDLIPSGRNVKVNESNKKEYVDLICQHRMTTAIEKQIKAYLDGFHEMIKPDLISVFNARELEMLISGMPDIDVTDLKKNTDVFFWLGFSFTF
jgi:E3 ubiquitin-protein ligase HUWE1